MGFIDAHSHLDHYQAELPAALAEINEMQILTVSTAVDIPSYLRTKALATASPWVMPTFGIHPWEAHRYADQLSTLDAYIAESPLLGEIGLDTVWDPDPTHYEAQRLVFEYFLAAAKAQNKVVNLHTKGAEQEILDLLRRYQVDQAIVHWYSGPLDVLDKLVDHGCYFTIGVEVLVSTQIQTIAQRVPRDRLLTETDNPGGQQWLTGALGMPRLIQTVAEQLATLHRLTLVELLLAVQTNFQRLVADSKHPALQLLQKVDHDSTHA